MTVSPELDRPLDFDQDEWEHRFQFSGGGNDGNNDDGDGYGGLPEDDEGGELHPEIGWGGSAGAIIGLGVGYLAVNSYDGRLANRLQSQQTFIAISGNKPASIQGLQGYNPNVVIEGGLALGPVVLLGAIGAAVAYKLKQRRNEKH